jgi:hypothetical protein
LELHHPSAARRNPEGNLGSQLLHWRGRAGGAEQARAHLAC